MTTCNSSLLSAYEYDDASWTLTVVFRSNNSVRAYADVPPEVFSEFDKAKSKGSFYNAHIKGKFESLKGGEVTDAEIADAVAETEAFAYVDEQAALGNTVEVTVELPPMEVPNPRSQVVVDLGITDDDIRAVDPEWNGVPISPEAAAKISEVLTPEEEAAFAAPQQKMGELQVMVAESNALIGKAPGAVVIRDREHYGQVAESLKKKVTQRAAMFAFLDPMRDIAFKAYKLIGDRQKTALDPMDASIKADKDALLAWDREQQRLAQIEQRRLQAEAEAAAAADQARRTEELRLQVAQEQAEAGDVEQAEVTLFDQSIQAPPVQVYVPRAQPTVPALAGLSGRKNWKATVVNFEDLVLDVAEGIKSMREKNTLAGHASINVLEAKMTALNQLAKANEDMLRIPGVRAFNDAVMNVRKG